MCTYSACNFTSFVLSWEQIVLAVVGIKGNNKVANKPEIFTNCHYLCRSISNLHNLKKNKIGNVILTSNITTKGNNRSSPFLLLIVAF